MVDMLSAEEKRAIELLEKLERLKHNQDFKHVITEHFSKVYALEVLEGLHQFSANSDAYNEKVRQLDAISMFNQFLVNLENEGQIARENERFLSKIPDEDF